MLCLINRFYRDERGAALVEYAMLLGLIAIVCIGGITLFGEDLSGALSIYAADLATI